VSAPQPLTGDERNVRAELAEARLGAVIYLHGDDDGTCEGCGDDWPCPTYRLANSIPTNAHEMSGHWRDSFGARWDRLIENGPTDD
jgi:hypothetical protein